MAKKTVNFRFAPDDLGYLEVLSEELHISRTDVLRQAIFAFQNLIQVAQADAVGVLAVIRERHEDEAEVALWVSQGADGEPEAHVRIDGVEPTDLGARAMVSPQGDTAFVFLDVNDASAEVLVPVGDDALLVRPRFAVGELPWPPQNYRIVLSLKDLAPTVSPEVSARLEKVEA